MVQRSLRYYYLRIVRQPGTPEQVAGGMALGLFASLVVPPGLQVATALAFAFMLRLNKISAVIGCLLTNPFTWGPIIFFQLVCGSYLTGVDVPRELPPFHDWWQFIRNFHATWHILRAYLTGAVVTGLISAAIGYYLTLWLVESFRQRKQQRLLMRTSRIAAVPAPLTPTKRHTPADPPPEPDKT